MMLPHDLHDLAELTGRVRASAVTTSRRAAVWTRTTATPAAREMIGQVRATSAELTGEVRATATELPVRVWALSATTSRRAGAWTRATAAPAALRAAPRAGIFYITHSSLPSPLVLML